MDRLRLRGNIILGGVLLALVVALVIVYDLSQRATYLDEQYTALRSTTLLDRHGEVIAQEHNSRGHYHLDTTSLPESFERALLQKEDRWFKYHPGINPASMIRALVARIKSESQGGASTITQQLVKTLLAQETERTPSNKLRELYYALALELALDKEAIFEMYVSSVYLGNQTQGFASASQFYFDRPVAELTESQWAQLLATLARPSTRNPWTKGNTSVAAAIAPSLGLSWEAEVERASRGAFRDLAFFELRTLLESSETACTQTCQTTIDLDVTRSLRSILARHISQLRDDGANSGAIVVLSIPDMEIISIIGSPDPYARSDGASINMAIAPRPVGSTIKPLIYLKGFQEGLRPYTLVDDAEYKFPIATGHALYPKNFDGQYRGEVTLHYALANSLNVPSVKVLEYTELESFYRYLEDDLAFRPIQPLDSYQYGIALGGLEMDLLTLTHYLSLFPAGGVLKPLSLSPGAPYLAPQSVIETEHAIAEPEYTELVTNILSDRISGVEQFGLYGNLSLSQSNYGVKTGTSRDYHDSWVVGFTPDFIVGVWLGNTNNTPLARLTGQSGAGRIWLEAMEYLLTTPYNKKTPLSHGRIESFAMLNSLEYGLPGDDVPHHRALMKSDRLIRAPHDRDQFLFSPETVIPLRAAQEVDWHIDDIPFARGTHAQFTPAAHGTYTISAHTPDQREAITIHIQLDQWELTAE